MSRRTIAELAGFQAVWLACALGAALGLSWPGMAAAAGFVAACLAASEQRRTLAVMVAVSGALGLVAESLLAAAGLLQHAASWPRPGIAPAWIVALWLAFGATVGATAELLGRWPVAKSAVLGAVFGPPAYAAGAGIGALAVPDPKLHAYAAIAVVWGLALPTLVWIWRRRLH